MNPYKSGNESLKIGLAIDFGMKNSRACTVINGEMSQVAQLGFSDKETIYTKPADKGVYDVKRLIGRSYRDPQIQHFKNIWKFPLSFLDNVPVVVRKNWLPSGASDVKDHIHDVLYHYFHFIVALWDLKGKLIENVVCTVPAHFNWYQRRVYEDVARYDTNLCRNVRTLSEPVAAAIAYFNNNPSKGNEILLVFHLASSTFDLTLLQVSGNNIEILAIGGDQYFGADSFDDTLLDHCLTECRRLTGKFEQRKDEFSLKKLFKWKSQCESVRKSVDPNVVHTVTLEYGISLFKSSAVPVSITRETFNAVNNRNFQRCVGILQTFLHDNAVNKSSISRVLLVGEGVKMPKLKEVLMGFLGSTSVYDSIDPEFMVAQGAALSLKHPGLYEEIRGEESPEVHYYLRRVTTSYNRIWKMLTMEDLDALKPPVYKGFAHRIVEIQKPIDRKEQSPKPGKPPTDSLQVRNKIQGPVIGIDLGTTFCCLAVERDGVMEVIQNNGVSVTPSYVLLQDEDFIVGELAKDAAHEHPENTIFHIKRMIGRHLSDRTIQNSCKNWPFKIASFDNKIQIQANGISLYPEDVLTRMVTYLKEVSEDYIGQEITNAVVAIPAHFNHVQRSLTVQAVSKTGWKVVQIITEPTAAALAYNSVNKNEELQHCLIFDLGGGTFDVAVLESKMGYVNILGIDGDPNLGGEDFDNELMNFCIEEFRKEHLVDLRAQPGSSNILRRLKVACEKQKRFLSEAKKAKVSVDAVHGKLPISVLITRDIFNSLIEKYIMICLKIVDRVLAKVNPPGIHEVVLVGGSSRIPLVQEMLKKRFPQKVIIRKFNPDEAVARGAAILGSLIEETSSSMTLIQEMGQMVLT